MAITPLKNPLENRPTVWRLCRHLGYDLTQIQLEELGHVTRVFYGSRPPRVSQKENGVWLRVFVYPPDFIPVMIEIAKTYYEANVKKKE